MLTHSENSVWHPYGHLIVPYWKDALTGSEEEALLRAAAATGFPRRNRALLLLLLHTGMRLHTCAALAWEDVSWVGTEAQVRFRNVQGQPLRTICLRDDASRALMEYGAAIWHVEPSFQQVIAVWPFPRFDGSSTALWENCHGWRLSSQGITRLLVELRGQAGMPMPPSHHIVQRFRATFARNYLVNHPGDFSGLLAQLSQTTLGGRSKEMQAQLARTRVQIRQVIDPERVDAALRQRKAVYRKRTEIQR